MAFTYKMVVPPYAYEELYNYMAERGLQSAKRAVAEILANAAQDDGAVTMALALARERADMLAGSNA